MNEEGVKEESDEGRSKCKERRERMKGKRGREKGRYNPSNLGVHNQIKETNVHK